jgi:hypothetical protein
MEVLKKKKRQDETWFATKNFLNLEVGYQYN